MQQNEIKVENIETENIDNVTMVETLDTDTLIEVLWTKQQRLQCLA